MSDFQDSNLQFNRRMSDLQPQPTIADVWGLLNEINIRLEYLERNFDIITTAFPIDDLNKPDYSGHRRQHMDIIKIEELVDSYKQDATKQIIKMAVTFIAGLLASGFVAKLAGFIQ